MSEKNLSRKDRVAIAKLFEHSDETHPDMTHAERLRALIDFAAYQVARCGYDIDGTETVGGTERARSLMTQAAQAIKDAVHMRQSEACDKSVWDTYEEARKAGKRTVGYAFWRVETVPHGYAVALHPHLAHDDQNRWLLQPALPKQAKTS